MAARPVTCVWPCRGSDKRELAADSLPVEDGGLSDSMSGSCQTDVLHPESSAELPVSCSTSDASQAPAVSSLLVLHIHQMPARCLSRLRCFKRFPQTLPEVELLS